MAHEASAERRRVARLWGFDAKVLDLLVDSEIARKWIISAAGPDLSQVDLEVFGPAWKGRHSGSAFVYLQFDNSTGWYQEEGTWRAFDHTGSEVPTGLVVTSNEGGFSFRDPSPEEYARFIRDYLLLPGAGSSSNWR